PGSRGNSPGPLCVTQGGVPPVSGHNQPPVGIPLAAQKGQREGGRLEKFTCSFLMVVGVINTDGTMTQEDISDYVAANMKDAISRTSGVGDVQLFGSQYAMRIWMNPNELNKFQLTPVDVITAAKEQNAQVAAVGFRGTPRSVPHSSPPAAARTLSTVLPLKKKKKKRAKQG
ncbi:efflux RND transporter permease subunit, partial [Escherichia coli]|nr:efflux RND transporter permease subunit [Escherichia coli]